MCQDKLGGDPRRKLADGPPRFNGQEDGNHYCIVANMLGLYRNLYSILSISHIGILEKKTETTKL